MGIYLNPDNVNFQDAVNDEIYIDKSGLLECTNKRIRTSNKYICVSRPRRFGKSTAADMLTAYYSRGCDSKELFSKFKIAKSEAFEKHLNKYNAIHINMLDFISEDKTVNESIGYLCKSLLFELKAEFGDVQCFDWNNLVQVLENIFSVKKVPFIIIIDEWDCVFRENQNDSQAQKAYLDFLKVLLKGKSSIALVYMTGILPIKKYGKHSALNMFTEIAMTNAAPLQEFTGFTENEVKKLCKDYNKDYNEVKRWYDGYTVDGVSIYNPKSVVEAFMRGNFRNYWTSTETYEALEEFILRDDDGLRDTVIKLLAGESQKIDPSTFQNDMVSFNSQDDVLTLLVHLGYLTFDSETSEVSIPNYEVSEQFASTIRNKNWAEVSKALKVSDELLKATLNCDEVKVAKLIADSHKENASVLQYNNENSLACVISIAYYSARNKYIMFRELPTGKGYADIVYLPRRNVNFPAMVIELKYEKSAVGAIEQIKKKEYTDKIAEYTGEILLVGINYDDEKGHTCKIEKFVK